MNPRFVNRLLSTPWHIAPASGRTIISHMLLALMKNERPEKDMWGDPLPKMRIAGDVAIIPISGILLLNCPDWIKSFGINATDPNDIEEEMEQALNDPNVAFIVQHTDSPGGEAVAGEKLYDLTEAAMKRKPMLTYCGDGAQLCSSAYQSAAPSMAILSGKFAEVGSIGSYMAYLDDSAFWEQMGIKWEVFRSGELKGVKGELTPEQRSYFEETVAAYGGRFRNGVSKYRTEIDSADMQGQTFRGIEAAQRGFSAGLAKDLDTAIAKFRRML